MLVHELMGVEKRLRHPYLVVERSEVSLLVVVLTYEIPVYLMGEVEEKRNPEEKLLEERLDPLNGHSAESSHVADRLSSAPPENTLHHQTSFDERLLNPVEIHQVVVHCDSNSLPNLVEADGYFERAEEGRKAL